MDESLLLKNTTIYGYTLEHLVLVAEMLKNEKITMTDLKDAEIMWRAGYNEAKRQFDNVMCQWLKK